MRAALKAEVRTTMQLALPIVATQVSMNLMGFVDTLMVGRLGPTELGAVAIGRAMFFTLGLVLVGTIAGIEPVISQAFGAGDRERGGKTLWQGLWIAVLLGLPLWWLLNDMRWMFRLTQQTEPVVEAAHVYLGTRAWATIPFLMFAASRSFLNAIGRPRSVLGVALGANVINAVLNYGLIFGNLGMPELGLRGAGIASALSTLTMAGCVLFMVRMQRGEGFALGWRWPDF
ncbi:MAG: MATE family efflux transporter, partial [Planctomycetota bacterium]